MESLKQIVGIYEITKSVAEAPVVQLKVASLKRWFFHCHFTFPFSCSSLKKAAHEVVLVGDVSVGKTHLLSRYMKA